ncbi:MAG: type II secretion system protein [Erysipelotrichaceae bacterium]
MKNKGFTTIEVIISLACLSLMIILLIKSLSIIKAIKIDQSLITNELAINEMRLIYAYSNEHDLSDDEYNFKYLDNIMHYYLDENKLVLTPGYQILLTNIDNFEFIKNDNCIYIDYYYKDELKHVLLGC